jgi:catechol 2,3-dioxygenase-like lactoylglutathione lyase family enzyme
MTSMQASNAGATEGPKAAVADFRLEVVVIPVSDVDWAKRFYASLGWRPDADAVSGEDFRVVQFTPPGSGASIIFGKGVTSATPGSVQDLQLTVSDIGAAREELIGRGVDVSDVFHDAGGIFHHAGTEARVAGPAPERASYGSFASFSDPDGNGWMLQEITTRLPGRVKTDVDALADRLREVEEQHGHYEPTAPPHHWSAWYAAYIVARDQGRTREEAYGDATRHVEGAQATQGAAS